MSRPDGRAPYALRPVAITPDFFPYAEGSALIEMGQTRVACAVSIEDRVPPFLVGKGEGWLTAEYAMLPRATHQRTSRETRGVGGRSHEIQRLIGRSLRQAVDLHALGERTLMVDCDVLQADGGTRTAAITGACVALEIALHRLLAAGRLQTRALRTRIAAISVGIVGGESLLDLCYAEDSQADADCNLVMAASGAFVEVQGTAEREPVPQDRFLRLLDLGRQGCEELLETQRQVVATTVSDV